MGDTLQTMSGAPATEERQAIAFARHDVHVFHVRDECVEVRQTAKQCRGNAREGGNLCRFSGEHDKHTSTTDGKHARTMRQR